MAQALTCYFFIYVYTTTSRHWDTYKRDGFTLGVLETSSLHSWGLQCTCHFSLLGGVSLSMCERQEAIIKESNTELPHTHTRTQARTTTVTQASEESNLCFGVLLWRSIEKEKQQCFIYSIFNSQSFIRRGIKKNHADFRNSLLRTWDLMRFEISMKSTSNLFKACSASISWQIFIAETIGRKHTGIYTFWDISPWRLVYQVVSEKS